MEPIRVIGRVDQAEQVHSVLLAAGADARLVTSAASTAVAETGRDGTGIDVLANGIQTCAAIKRRVPARPVVIVTFDEQGAEMCKAAAYAAKSSRGPDAHLPWPASGTEILAACEKAMATPDVQRPRLLYREVLVWVALLGMLGVVIWALGFEIQAKSQGLRHEGSPWPRALMHLILASLFASSAVWNRKWLRTSLHESWHRTWSVICYVFAGFSLLRAVAAFLA